MTWEWPAQLICMSTWYRVSTDNVAVAGFCCLKNQHSCWGTHIREYWEGHTPAQTQEGKEKVSIIIFLEKWQASHSLRLERGDVIDSSSVDVFLNRQKWRIIILRVITISIWKKNLCIFSFEKKHFWRLII